PEPKRKIRNGNIGAARGRYDWRRGRAPARTGGGCTQRSARQSARCCAPQGSEDRVEAALAERRTLGALNLLHSYGNRHMNHMTPVPHLVVNDGEAAISFYQNAFGATLAAKHPADDGKRLMHAHLKLGSADLF